MRRYYGSFVGLVCRGEMIPNDDSYCEIDPQTKDQYGIPTLRFHWKWSEHEKRQALHSHKTFTEVIEQMGGTRHEQAGPAARAASSFTKSAAPSWAATPKNSVVNQWGQTWDVKNLFITDGAPFPSNADKNPTLTIMALAWRALGLHAGGNEAEGAVTWTQ